jgi:murein DD-endopeptidase MepM/ murein hydrolase activator NlpD
MSILIYLIKVNLALMLSWALFRVAFRNLSFFQWNRYYLLGSVVLSLILPLLRLQWNSTMAAAVNSGGIDWTYMDHLVSAPLALTGRAGGWSPASVLLVLYILVALTLLFRSIYRLIQLFKSTGRATKIRSGRVKVYVQDQQKGSLTLFRRIYLDPYAYENNLSPVLRHEMVHATQLHSLDLLFMEFVVAMLWFNPFVYVLFGYVRDNHEYLADRHAQVEGGSLTAYLECLKAETIRNFSPVPASYFKSSTIKKRIIMLTNHNTNHRKKWRYLGIIPLLALIVLLFHSPQSKSMAIAATESFFLWDGIPDHFPLPEEYRGKVSWGFDQKAIHPISKKALVHKGIDMPAPKGTPVYAAGGGVVLKAEVLEGWGKLIVLAHSEGYTTFYAHLDEISVEPGATVAVGQVIGKVGNSGQSTGPHLHYEVRLNDEQVDPSDFY